ncbi:unnamed protein product [Rhizoctonia solani]|uniref:Large ribosomal subunit protein eL24-related N-terminal domain-containing protein n=1 Tax=Rhizoctonia solani TaxID=456999 RepID=A0A8H3BBF5_9AGAM|nr:unnamed protein product [Rhizoctonia solani]
MKVEIDSFSGRKIYPSKGKLYVRGDSKVGPTDLLGFELNPKQPYRSSVSRRPSRRLSSCNARTPVRSHGPSYTGACTRRRGLAEETVKKRSRKAVKHQRGIVGADLAAIQARRNQTTAEREKARADAIAKAKAEKKKKEDAKTKTKPAARAPTGAPKVSKQQMKGGKGGR